MTKSSGQSEAVADKLEKSIHRKTSQKYSLEKISVFSWRT